LELPTHLHQLLDLLIVDFLVFLGQHLQLLRQLLRQHQQLQGVGLME
jgi:hypothetical protein